VASTAKNRVAIAAVRVKGLSTREKGFFSCQLVKHDEQMTDVSPTRRACGRLRISTSPILRAVRAVSPLSIMSTRHATRIRIRMRGHVPCAFDRSCDAATGQEGQGGAHRPYKLLHRTLAQHARSCSSAPRLGARNVCHALGARLVRQPDHTLPPHRSYSSATARAHAPSARPRRGSRSLSPVAADNTTRRHTSASNSRNSGDVVVCHRRRRNGHRRDCSLHRLGQLRRLRTTTWRPVLALRQHSPQPVHLFSARRVGGCDVTGGA